MRVDAAPDASGDALEFVLCDIATTDGEPWECCPRSFLRAALQELHAQTGLRVLASFEHEFQLLSDAPPALAFSLEAQRRAEPFPSQVFAALRQAGAAPERFMAEYAAHQFEIPVAAAGGIGAADRAVVLREVVREVARHNGVRATFSPLLDPAHAGNGVHIHISLLDDDGRAALYDASRPGCLSELGASFAAGVLEHADALSAICAPSPVSAERLAPHRWSAGAKCLGLRNRETLLRIPPLVASLGEQASQMRLEYRGADGAANPYLALGAIVRAGLEGIRAGLSPPPMLDRDPAQLGDDEASGYGVGALPGSLAGGAAGAGARRRGACVDDAVDVRRLHGGQARGDRRPPTARSCTSCAGAMATSTDTLLAALLALIEGELPDAVRLRRLLHEQPELAHEELRTAAIVADALPVASTTVAGTGRLARVGPSHGAVLAMRAELDGLPIRENTGAPFSAAGATMHACGHDVHMAALVALARAAHKLGEELPLALLAIFQPSEEAFPSGAEQLAREGALAAHDPAAVLAAHVHPGLPWGAAGLDAGAVNASSDSVEIVVEGQPSHGAYPHLGRDPVLAIAQVVVALHAQASRRIDPLGPTVLNVGVLEGGGAENVIPARARASATIRALRAEDRRALREMVVEVVEGVAAAHGCRGHAELIVGEPALENDARIVAASRPLLAQGGFAHGPGVALVRLGRLLLLRRARARGDGLRRAGRRAGFRHPAAAPP